MRGRTPCASMGTRATSTLGPCATLPTLLPGHSITRLHPDLILLCVLVHLGFGLA